MGHEEGKRVVAAGGDEEVAPDLRREVGFRGEDIAADFMVEQGWDVVARNYQLNIGEIDLVVRRSEEVYGRREDTLAIVEVKTKRDRRGPPPEASVTHAKRKRLVRLACVFMERQKIRRVNIRFDVIAVDLSTEEPTITHFPGAFDADAEIR
ncbi:YraN family protein [Bradymonas sediminis]|nr:YraN family protein [Bradymonas sediminis]TDP75673.1 putative endonuclease [Bradymonas sediminis]